MSTKLNNAKALFEQLIAHENSQSQMIVALSELLQEAMDEMGADDTEWYPEAQALLALINGEPVKPVSQPVPQAVFTPQQNVDANEAEKGFGEMSESELERHFQTNSKPAPKKPRRLKEMSTDEINRVSLKDLQELVDDAEAEERAQDNSTDIYKIKGRIQNLAVSISGGNLTPVGEMMVNSFVHVVKDLYDFADTLQDSEVRAKLREKIKKHESMPGTLIAAASAGVKVKK